MRRSFVSFSGERTAYQLIVLSLSRMELQNIVQGSHVYMTYGHFIQV